MFLYKVISKYQLFFALSVVQNGHLFIDDWDLCVITLYDGLFVVLWIGSWCLLIGRFLQPFNGGRQFFFFQLLSLYSYGMCVVAPYLNTLHSRFPQSFFKDFSSISIHFIRTHSLLKGVIHRIIVVFFFFFCCFVLGSIWILRAPTRWCS